MRWKYRKLMANLANAVDATTAPGPTRAGLTDLLRAEGEECLAAAKTELVSEDEDRRPRGDILHVTRFGAQPAGSSSWQSLHRGTGSIEADYINGEIVLLGRLHGVATPANELIRRTANRLAATGAPPRSLTVRALLDQLRS